MLRWAVGYGAVLVALGVLDGLYLSQIGAKLFKATLGDVMAPSVNVAPAVIFYLMYPVALLVFAVTTGGELNRWPAALGWGALFGLFAYGTYDLTNWATIRNWTGSLVMSDLAWGATVSGLSALAGALAMAWMARAG